MSTAEARQRLLARFREISQERVERISAALLDLEGGRAGRAAALGEIARELHTLKGEAAMMGFAPLATVAHALEDRFAAGGDPGALLVVVRALPGLLEESHDSKVEEILARLAPVDPGPATAPGPLPEALPAPDARVAPATLRVNAGALDELASLGGDLRVDGAQAQARARQLSALLARWAAISDRFLRLAERRSEDVSHAELDAVAADVHGLRSEGFRLMRHHLEAVELVQERFQLLATRVESVRLVPLDGTFPRFRLAAQELAHAQGKRLVFELSGGSVGVDRDVLLALGDALIHLVRNAVDHGLETPGERELAGKSPAGVLAIVARTEADQLVVTVQDDGRGIDPRRVLDTAVLRGLVSRGAASELSPAQVLDLIFTAGFSTREQASNISGRGVGLDVVRRSVGALGGSVSVDSQQGRGTRFTLRLPQSLLLLHVLLLEVDGDLLAIPAADVEAVDRLRATNLVLAGPARLVRHREGLVPLVPLARALGLGIGPAPDRPVLAFVRSAAGVVALAADRFLGQREVTIKPLGAFLRGLRLVSGAATMEDGRVALLLATGELIAATRGLQAAAARTRAPKRRVLVVDDSPIAREATASMLRSLGHVVEVAENGAEAFLRLEHGRHDALVTDVDMPVLDGLGLTRKVRSTPELRHVPIVIVSSMAGPGDRRRGLEAGADVYLGKGELDAATLAAALERIEPRKERTE